MLAPSAVEILYLVAIAHVWSRGTLFRWIRTLGLDEGERKRAGAFRRAWIALADCPLCSGWWIGVLGHTAYIAAPVVITWLGVGSVVGTCTLALCGMIRRI